MFCKAWDLCLVRVMLGLAGATWAALLNWVAQVA